MPWFIKTEHFNTETVKLLPEFREKYIEQHRTWLFKLKNEGIQISSGYLVNKNHCPGGGGLLILEANSYAEAKSIIEHDPMIEAGLVTWQLQEWIEVYGQPIVCSQRG